MGGETILVVEQEKDSNENQKEEVNKIWMHVALFKLLDICGYIYCDIHVLIICILFHDHRMHDRSRS